jgi:serine/threonine protein kinase
MQVDAKRVQSVFLAVVECGDASERAATLDRECAADLALRKRVEALLQANDAPDSMLDTPPAASRQRSESTLLADNPGTIIGPYKLIEQIGEGGMGLVFMAEQKDPVRRKVALKVLKPGMDTRHVVARFEAERQAIALMDHPNIAKFFDAGTTGAVGSGQSSVGSQEKSSANASAAACQLPLPTTTGRPYFVMELVRGVPITEFCDQRRLTVRQRLEIFIDVCQAVQHAHQKGIIHRDLKPNNILVTLYDHLAVPKVIDFGIAKATQQPLTDRSLVTHFSQMVGTPLYMSPEQAEMNGLDVDTRSDVYSLGVLLYELLTGTTPFESERLKKIGFDEMRRVIREEEPPRPSQRISTLDAAARSTLSERRGADVRNFASMLRGELDWIVVKALEKDRNRRYESASAFAADVQRYLTNEAVEACPPSCGYRLRKFARRNCRALVTAAIVVVALVSATGISAWQAVTARDALRRADSEAAIARAVSDFLQTDLLDQAAGEAAPGQEFEGEPHLTVKVALDRAAVQVNRRFKDQPLVEAAIRTTIGNAYNKLAEHRLTVPHLQRAVELHKVHLGDDHANTLDSMRGLAKALGWLGRFQDAATLRQQITETYKSTLGPDHPTTLGSMGALISALESAGQHDVDATVRSLELLFDKQRTICGPSHADTLDTMSRLAIDYWRADRFPESIDLHEKLLAHMISQRGARNPSTIFCRICFAYACQQAGRLDQAEGLLNEALKINHARDDSVNRRKSEANLRGWLARTLFLQKRYADAEPHVREAVTRFEILQPDSYRRFYWVSLLGAVYMGQELYEKAEPLLLQGYEGMKQREAVLPLDEKPRLVEVGERIVRFYEVTQQPEKARAWRGKLVTVKSPQ